MYTCVIHGKLSLRQLKQYQQSGRSHQSLVLFDTNVPTKSVMNCTVTNVFKIQKQLSKLMYFTLLTIVDITILAIGQLHAEPFRRTAFSVCSVRFSLPTIAAAIIWYRFEISSEWTATNIFIGPRTKFSNRGVILSTLVQQGTRKYKNCIRHTEAHN